MVGKMIDEGMLRKLNFDNIPNYQYIGENYRNLNYDPENAYSVPYTWGTVGIFYNTKYVDEADLALGWDLLWCDKYKDRILMFNNPRDSFAIAEAKLGYSINTTNEQEIEAAAKELIAQKPLVQAYVMDQIFDKMTEENAWVAPYYAGDYITMSETNEDLKFVFPKEGFNQFVDSMCIPKGCVNQEAAEMFINFMCEPRVSAENCSYIGYSTPISAAKDLMDAEVVENEVAYPDSETLANSETFRNLSDDTNKLLDDLWIEVRIGTITAGFWIAVGFLAMGVIALCAMSIYRKQKRLRARNAVK
jgi:spermidine/putrescine transport system substrate-binding protein